jgi:micrococcal nuclease
MITVCLWFGVWCTISAPNAYVYDGDTIYLWPHGASVAIRLEGVDAEELNEPHGAAAKDAMKAIVRDHSLECVVSGRSYNRYVATCRTEDDLDIGEELIRRGFALDCAHYSGGRYRSFEPAGARTKLLQKPYC